MPVYTADGGLVYPTVPDFYNAKLREQGNHPSQHGNRDWQGHLWSRFGFETIWRRKEADQKEFMQWYNDCAGKDELVLFSDGSYNMATGQGGWAVIRALGSNGRSNVYEYWCSGSMTVADRMFDFNYRHKRKELQVKEVEIKGVTGALEETAERAQAMVAAGLPLWSRVVIISDSSVALTKTAKWPVKDSEVGTYLFPGAMRNAAKLRALGVDVRFECVKRGEIPGNMIADAVAKVRSGCRDWASVLKDLAKKSWPVENLPRDAQSS